MRLLEQGRRRTVSFSVPRQDTAASVLAPLAPAAASARPGVQLPPPAQPGKRRARPGSASEAGIRGALRDSFHRCGSGSGLQGRLAIGRRGRRRPPVGLAHAALQADRQRGAQQAPAVASARRIERLVQENGSEYGGVLDRPGPTPVGAVVSSIPDVEPPPGPCPDSGSCEELAGGSRTAGVPVLVRLGGGRGRCRQEGTRGPRRSSLGGSAAPSSLAHRSSVPTSSSARWGGRGAAATNASKDTLSPFTGRICRCRWTRITSARHCGH